MSIKKRTDIEPPKDLDPFPFGKYKGTPYQDVPVNYLHWCHHNTDSVEVKAYVYHNLHALMEENEDLIWSK